MDDIQFTKKTLNDCKSTINLRNVLPMLEGWLSHEPLLGVQDRYGFRNQLDGQSGNNVINIVSFSCQSAPTYHIICIGVAAVYESDCGQQSFVETYVAAGIA
jgi:hypothetical protein